MRRASSSVTSCQPSGIGTSTGHDCARAGGQSAAIQMVARSGADAAGRNCGSATFAASAMDAR
jgi:hypothetical protein